MREFCPTCESPVKVIEDDHGKHYEPLAQELKRVYPESVFSSLSSGELETIKAALLGCGVRNASDRLHAQWARHWAGLLT